MFRLEEKGNNEVVLHIELPQGQTNYELINHMLEELNEFKNRFFGKKVKVNGRLTVPLALSLGHELAHVCQEVHMFDPKLNEYIKVIWH